MGEAWPERLNGIFAFAVWEDEKETLFLARDHVGVKPFFYTLPEECGFLFASELKALLRHPAVPHEVDADGVAEPLLIGLGRTPGQGVFRGIRELLPGQCGTFSREGQRLRKYWALTARPHAENEADTPCIRRQRPGICREWRMWTPPCCCSVRQCGGTPKNSPAAVPHHCPAGGLPGR